MRLPAVLVENSAFRALWLSRVISFAGDGAAAVALVLLAADAAGPAGVSLLLLAPDIQEEILFLPRSDGGRDPIREKAVRPIASVPDWRKQRVMWRDLKAGLPDG